MANEKNVKETTNFNFRSKFKNLLTEDINSSEISGAFEMFCCKKPEVASNLLWYLTYGENSATITFNVLGLDFGCVPTIQLRNELRYQYNILHPGFLTCELTSQAVKEAYEALKVKTDLIVSNVVYKHCCSKMFLTEYEISRIIYLLTSDDEKNFFGGIRALGFAKEEALYLKAFHKEILNLFKALYDAEQPDSKNLPFKDVEQLITTTSTEDSVDNQAEVCVEDKSKVSAEDQTENSEGNLPVESSHKASNQDNATNFKSLTAEEILANKDIFTSFAKNNNFESLTLLVTAGFDMNLVISKKVEISDFIDAVEALKQ